MQILPHQVPEGWSQESVDFINKMIQRKSMNRLGVNGPDEVLQHPWLADYPWADLSEMKIMPPFTPPKGDNFDLKNSLSQWNDEQNEAFQNSKLILRRDSVQELFTRYEYDEMNKILQLKSDL